MIYVYEPLCRDISHESFNAGFVELIAKAFPEESILIYAHDSHISVLLDRLDLKYKSSPRSRFEQVDWPSSWTFFSAIRGFIILYKLSREWDKAGGAKVVFLSYNKIVLALLKLLEYLDKERFGKILLVSHGLLEEISSKSVGMSHNPRDMGRGVISMAIIRRRLLQFIGEDKGLKKTAYKIFSKIICKIREKLDVAFNRITPSLQEIMAWGDSQQIRYLLLSDHIAPILNDLVSLKGFMHYSVPLPREMKGWSPAPHGSKPIFSVFGYGNPIAIKEVLEYLEISNIHKEYEIRLIGCMPRYLYGYRNVVMPSPGDVMIREDMEEWNREVNIQIILYPADYYRLSCSGSIFEALAYNKPILHLRNPCISYYNNITLPIGYQVENLKDVATEIQRISNEFNNLEDEISVFHNNLKILRDKYSIDRAVPRFRDIFEAW